MNRFCAKINKIRENLVLTNSDFTLFALVKLKANPKKWDVVVCADWLPTREMEAIRVIADEIKKALAEPDYKHLSGIVILNKEDLFCSELIALEKSSSEAIHNLKIAGLEVKEAIILQMPSVIGEIKQNEFSKNINKLPPVYKKQSQRLSL